MSMEWTVNTPLERVIRDEQFKVWSNTAKMPDTLTLDEATYIELLFTTKAQLPPVIAAAMTRINEIFGMQISVIPSMLVTKDNRVVLCGFSPMQYSEDTGKGLGL